MPTHENFYSYASNNDPASGGNHTVPEWTLGTGNYITTGKQVTGTATAFLSEFRRGDWIFSSAKQKCEMVVNVDSDTVMYLRDAFASDVVSESVKVVPRCSLNTIRVKSLSGATVLINNVALTATNTFEATNNGSPSVYLDPVAVNVSAGTAEVTTVE